jgi:hypothetical protein
MTRVIGIRHRVKQTAEGAARPTQLAILEKGKKKAQLVELKTEDDELKFITEGVERGDRFAMLLGGSGDRFAFALSRRTEELSGQPSVYRLPPHTFAALRNEDDKDQDPGQLAQLLSANPDIFYNVDVREREFILLREAYRARVDAMKARIACEQRLRSSLIGTVFCSVEGGYPEGTIEEAFDKLKASDAIYLNLEAEEKLREKRVAKIIEKLPVYSRIFEPIKGVGPMIAARLIVAIGDIRRFETESKLTAFTGCIPDSENRLKRHRRGEVGNYHPEARQALFLLGDQFNRRPDSEWGQVLRTVKTNLRKFHPEPVEVTNAAGKKVKRYTDGHIHKMAIWYTLNTFVRSLWRDWTDLEAELRPKSNPGLERLAS